MKIYVVLLRTAKHNMRTVAVRDRFGSALYLARGLMQLAEGSDKYHEQLYGRDMASFFFSNALPGQTFPIVKIESQELNADVSDLVFQNASQLGDLK